MRYGIEPAADPRGFIRVWEWPAAGEKYIVGADVAEGTVNGDSSAAWVIKARNMEHVATFYGKLDPYAFANELNGLGRFYNLALLAPEKNNHGEAVVRELIHTYEYPNLYHRVLKGTDKQKDNKPAREFGWLTREPQKRAIQAMLNKVIGAGVPIHDHRFKVEALTWLLDDRGKPETADGACDDVLMAAGIAYCVAAEHYGVQFEIRAPLRPRTPDQFRRDENRREWGHIFDQVSGKGRTPHDPNEGVPNELIF